MAEDLYSGAEVFALLGLPYNRDDVRVTCPKCGKKKFYMQTKENKGLCFSAKCGFKANPMSFYAATYGISNKEAHAEILDKLGIKSLSENERKNRVPIAISPVHHMIDMADIDRRDSVYRALLSHLKLNEKNHNNLLQRGFTEDEIQKLGYVSNDFDYDDARRIARVLMHEGHNVKGIPGFFTDKYNNWTMRKLKPGIIMPFKNVNNKIQGLQVRKNDDVLDIYKDGSKEKKCNYFSSNDRENGSVCTSFVHFACDFEFKDGIEVPIIPNGILHLTEGVMKADLAHLISGNAYIAVPGVNALTELRKLLASGILKQLGVTTIVLEYDMDYLTNENVFTAVETVKSMIIENGFIYERNIWFTDTPSGMVLNGTDDFYAYHFRNVIR